jgi:hypothetical protein
MVQGIEVDLFRPDDENLAARRAAGDVVGAVFPQCARRRGRRHPLHFDLRRPGDMIREIRTRLEFPRT